MNLLRQLLAKSPTHARVAPFVIFFALTFAQSMFGPAANYWFYLVKTLVGVWLIWEMRSLVAEMRWAFSWEAVVVGVGVCAVWVGLDSIYPRLSTVPEKLWNPHAQFGADSALAWLFVMTRLLGSTFVVPPLEETFYRSWVCRMMARNNFEAVPVGYFSWSTFLATSVIFGLAHAPLWIEGVICGLAYQWLVVHKKRLGDAMTAHAITNFLLAVWIIWKGDWKFW